jgi:hypothetical protein
MIELELSKHMHRGGLLGVGSTFLNISMGYSKSNQNYSFILIISLAFVDRGLGSLNTCHFQHNTELGHSFIDRWKPPIWMKTYETYFKEYINMIYIIVNNPRLNMHRFLETWGHIYVDFKTQGQYSWTLIPRASIAWIVRPWVCWGSWKALMEQHVWDHLAYCYVCS